MASQSKNENQMESREPITYDKLPAAVTYLIQEVDRLKAMVENLRPPTNMKRTIVDIDEASEITRIPKSTLNSISLCLKTP